MGYLGRRIGLSQDSGDSNPGGADGAVGGGILDLFTNGYFERQGDIYNAPGVQPSGMVASGGVVSDYVVGSDIYRAHVFTSSGTFAVTAIGDYGAAVDYLVVAGGGGGGQEGGGGGAGGVRSSHPDVPSPNQGSALNVAIQSYAVTVGAGGIGAHFQMPNGTPAECNGSPSHFGPGSPIPINTSGGGAGGSKRNENTGPEIPTTYRGGRAGGSGGGAARDSDNQGGGAANYPAHTKQIGNIGGNSPGNGANSAGGGGGAGAQGQNQRHPDSGGHGGQGMRIRIAGNPVNPSPIGYPGPGSGADATGYFAAGGGGGGHSGPGGTGGSYDGSSFIPGGPYGGAGNGTWNGDPNSYGSAPSASQGSGSGGGGGGWNPGGQRGGQGGSGIIVLRYQIGQTDTGSAKATGGAISYYNNKTIHVFNHSGTFTAPSPLNPSPLAVTYVVVAGGGSGAGPGGGGGAGQYITGPTTVTAGGSVSVQVGGGGAARSTAAAWATAGGRLHQLTSKRMLEDGPWSEGMTEDAPTVFADFDGTCEVPAEAVLLKSSYKPMEGSLDDRIGAIIANGLDGRWLLVAQHLACWRRLWTPERADDLPDLGLLLTRLLEAECVLASYA